MVSLYCQTSSEMTYNFNWTYCRQIDLRLPHYNNTNQLYVWHMRGEEVSFFKNVVLSQLQWWHLRQWDRLWHSSVFLCPQGQGPGFRSELECLSHLMRRVRPAMWNCNSGLEGWFRYTTAVGRLCIVSHCTVLFVPVDGKLFDSFVPLGPIVFDGFGICAILQLT